MPRNYQCKRGNPYLLPHDIYMRVLYTVKGYDRRQAEYESLLYDSMLPPDGQPKGNKLSDRTADNGIKRALISEELEAVDQSLMMVAPEYRQGVKDNVMYGIWYPRYADIRTYQRYKQRFLHYVAQRLKLI